MHIVVSKHDSVVSSHRFEDDVIGIGSDPDQPVYLPDGRIAAHQANLRAVDGTWTVEPLDHEHALILNAQVVDDPAPVRDGDEIRLADFTLRLYLDIDQSAAPSKPVAADVAKLREHALPPGSIARAEREIVLSPEARGRVGEFARRLPKCADVAELLTVSASSLRNVFDARMAWVGLRRKAYGELDRVDGVRKDGKPCGDPPHSATFQYRCVEQDQFIVVPRTEETETRSAMAVPLRTGLGTMGMVYLDSPAGGASYGRSELDELMMYGTLVAGRFEGLIEHEAEAQRSIVAGELSFVRQVQAHMDPTSVPEWEQLQIAVYCKPGSERSGDIYDVMRLPNGLASFLVAHARGETMRVAMAMTEVRAAFRMAAMHADPPHILLRALNWMLRSDRDQCSLSCAAIVMNPKSGACEYATAGDIGAIIVDHSGEPRTLADTTISPLGQGGDHQRPACAERIAEGETLVFYSPGCRSIMDRNGVQLGDGPLTGALCDGFGQPAAAALKEVLGDLSAFFKDGRQPDDITMLLVHRI